MEYKKRLKKKKRHSILVQLNPSPNERTYVVLRMHQQMVNERTQMV